MPKLLTLNNCKCGALTSLGQYLTECQNGNLVRFACDKCKQETEWGTPEKKIEEWNEKNPIPFTLEKKTRMDEWFIYNGNTALLPPENMRLCIETPDGQYGGYGVLEFNMVPVDGNNRGIPYIQGVGELKPGYLFRVATKNKD